MNLHTTYLGLDLRSPLVASASPLTLDLDNVRRLEDAGAGAVVFHSLFQEQLDHERYLLPAEPGDDRARRPDALDTLDYLQGEGRFLVDPDAYAEHIAAAKKAAHIPIIASLNASTTGDWVDYARRIEQAGADALELNIYHVPTDLGMDARIVESTCYEMFVEARKAVDLPIAVKLSPFFTNFANVAKCFDQLGAQGLVLFNRFYQPDIELETREVSPNILLSTPMDLRLPMRWIAILHGRIGADLAATGGIHCGTDALKLLMAGACVTMFCSVLLQRGIGHLRVIEREMREWMEEHEFASVKELRGLMSDENIANPAAFERAQYLRGLTGFR